jgi:hypothetical protein
LAWFGDVDPHLPPVFGGMVEDRPLHAKELVPSLKQRWVEGTIIFNNGIGVGDRMYAHYMSVQEYQCVQPCPPTKWTINGAGIAYSDDEGNSWTKAPYLWGPDSNFGIVAFAHVDGFVYLLGVPAGRHGSPRLARVREVHVLTAAAYRYWTGRGWSSHEDDATAVAEGPAGELSVQWNSHYRKWLATYTGDGTNNPPGRVGIVMRWADCLTGPWSDPQVVVTGELGEGGDDPALVLQGPRGRLPVPYAGFIAPGWGDRPDVYLGVSEHETYGVYWVHTSLTGVEPGTGPERCINP